MFYTEKMVNTKVLTFLVILMQLLKKNQCILSKTLTKLMFSTLGDLYRSCMFLHF